MSTFIPQSLASFWYFEVVSPVTATITGRLHEESI
jgi:hypothetical protein